jgi:hypothetical protein
MELAQDRVQWRALVLAVLNLRVLLPESPNAPIVALMHAGSGMAIPTTEFPPTTEFLSDDMKFNDGHRMSIITYSVLMVVSAVGNITVLVNILRRRRSLRFGNNYMFMHLAIADLLVSAEPGRFNTLTQRFPNW